MLVFRTYNYKQEVLLLNLHYIYILTAVPFRNHRA